MEKAGVRCIAIDPKALVGPSAQCWVQTFIFPECSQKKQTSAEHMLVTFLAEWSFAPLPPCSLGLLA